MFCSNCGVEIPDDSLFCTSCGAKNEGQQIISSTEKKAKKIKGIKEKAPSEKKKKGRLVRALVLVILVVFVAGVAKISGFRITGDEKHSMLYQTEGKLYYVPNVNEYIGSKEEKQPILIYETDRSEGEIIGKFFLMNDGKRLYYETEKHGVCNLFQIDLEMDKENLNELSDYRKKIDTDYSGEVFQLDDAHLLIQYWNNDYVTYLYDGEQKKTVLEGIKCWVNEENSLLYTMEMDTKTFLTNYKDCYDAYTGRQLNINVNDVIFRNLDGDIYLFRDNSIVQMSADGEKERVIAEQVEEIVCATLGTQKIVFSKRNNSGNLDVYEWDGKEKKILSDVSTVNGKIVDEKRLEFVYSSKVGNVYKSYLYVDGEQYEIKDYVKDYAIDISPNGNQAMIWNYKEGYLGLDSYELVNGQLKYVANIGKEACKEEVWRNITGRWFEDTYYFIMNIDGEGDSILSYRNGTYKKLAQPDEVLGEGIYVLILPSTGMKDDYIVYCQNNKLVVTDSSGEGWIIGEKKYTGVCIGVCLENNEKYVLDYNCDLVDAPITE